MSQYVIEILFVSGLAAVVGYVVGWVWLCRAAANRYSQIIARNRWLILNSGYTYLLAFILGFGYIFKALRYLTDPTYWGIFDSFAVVAGIIWTVGSFWGLAEILKALPHQR